jgi:murein DD-endopeptidase MepM/ murein hydrolase activator NlpD
MLEEFAVFKGDFRDPWEDRRYFNNSQEFNTESLLGLVNDPLGIPERPALVWPSLRGTQNGGPFRYACRTPRVSRDVVGFCSGHGNAFLEWPFEIAKVSQPPDGDFTHQNDEAWDIPVSLETPVFTARPGHVLFVRDTEGDTCDPDVDEPGDPQCAGNWVTIQHSDGSTASYGHLQKNKAFVDEDERVQRGRVIALSGNTGYSTGPHLHLETKRSGFRENAWFHAWLGLGIDEVNCYKPKRDDLLLNLELP